MSDEWTSKDMGKVRSYRWMIKAKSNLWFLFAMTATMLSVVHRYDYTGTDSYQTVQLMFAISVGLFGTNGILWWSRLHRRHGLDFIRHYEDKL